MKIKYYIPTRDRYDKQKTLFCLPKNILKDTYIVCEENQIKKYISSCVPTINKKNILAFPYNYGKNIIKKYGCFSDKKQFILENTNADYIYFLDDDLEFLSRDKQYKLHKADKQEVKIIFEILNNWLNKGINHIGLSARMGNNRETKSFVENTRSTNAVGFNVKIIKENKIKLNRLLLMSDFDTTLSLLELGFKNRVLFDFAYSPSASNSVGGCSLYRTPETMKSSAELLHSLHPKFVKVKKKTTKKPWSGFKTKTRYDVIISWKKAFAFGLNKKKKPVNIYF